MGVDLTTRYLGLELCNPIVPSSSPMTRDVDTIRRLEDAGAAAVVLPSLFEEEIDWEPARADARVRHVEAVKQAVDIPVIASLNGCTDGGWVEHGLRLQRAGADAIELNVYYLPTDPRVPAAEVEQRYVDLVARMTRKIDVPVAVKVGPFFSAIPHMIGQLAGAGARGVVLFNRFTQPDIDVDELAVAPHLVLSSSYELLLPLRWIAILHGRVPCDLAATTGVHTADDVIKLLLAGADVAMMASALLKGGPERVTDVIEQLSVWLEEHGHDSLDAVRGSLSQRRGKEPDAFERANYVETLNSYEEDIL